ncbi:MAG TPA: Uma2 family endonuclease [Gemmataceae bacterium]|nr:Uma2 family endonuclease [Gemmataceae bacterium]
MAMPTTIPPKWLPLGLPLENGDRMRQPEFHRRYEQCPEGVKFELVGGIVYMASPLILTHSNYDEELSFPYGVYRRATEGVAVIHGASTFLGEESEPQPDLGLFILPEYGGQTTTTVVKKKLYIKGPPELLTEIAVSARALDMHLKQHDYRKAGVREYVVLCVEEEELHWFDFHQGGMIEPDVKGVFRSRVFPGLWIDGPALLARDSAQVEKLLRQGLKSQEHAAFVLQLKKARTERKQRRA